MFLKTAALVTPKHINFSRRLLSTEIKNVLSIRCPNGTNGNNVQLAFVSKNLNALNLDLFVNNLSQHEDRSSEVLDLLAKFRSTKFANTCLDSTHFAVVGHMLENLTIQELVPILLDRPKYGIFLNNFTGFAVAQTLHEEKEYVLGLSLALKLVLSEETTNSFIQWFCLKASLEALKKERSADQPTENLDEKPIKKVKIQETKVRVKFIRNVYESDINFETGNAILKIGSNILEGNAKDNVEILGFVLTKNYTQLNKVLNKGQIEISADVSDICKRVLSSENQTEFANKIGEMENQTIFEDIVDKFLKETADKEANLLAEEQKLLFPIWQQQKTQLQLNFEKEIANRDRREKIEVMENEIATKKELLWYFDQEEQIDLEIFKKQKFYPKRWFGKKKKPRVIDEHYVPPQIRKIN